MGFNPRARVGRDRLRRKSKWRNFCVSIHAPAWGATGSVARANGEIFVFQSTRPRGARRDKAKEIALRFGFQSTRPRGARLEISL